MLRVLTRTLFFLFGELVFTSLFKEEVVEGIFIFSSLFVSSPTFKLACLDPDAIDVEVISIDAHGGLSTSMSVVSLIFLVYINAMY